MHLDRIMTVPAAAALIALSGMAFAAPAHAVSPISVTIEPSVGQTDPSTSCTLSFTAVFGGDVTGFSASDVAISGTAGATTAVVSGGPATYTVTISGMTAPGDVVVSIPADVAGDGTNTNSASTSSDNVVTWSAPVPDTCAAVAAAQSAASAIPAWVQAYGRASKDATCVDGWTPSWQSWAEPVTGGWVCTRSVPSAG